MDDSERLTVGELEERAAAGDPAALRTVQEWSDVVAAMVEPLLDNGQPPRLRNPLEEVVQELEASNAQAARAIADERRLALRRERMMLAMTACSLLAAVASVVVALLR